MMMNPWPQHTMTGKDLDNWEILYPEILYKETDPLQGAADFYLLFGVSQQLFVKFDSIKLPDPVEVSNAALLLELSVAEIQERASTIKDWLLNDKRLELDVLAGEAKELFDKLVISLDRIFCAYIQAACGGELRHHPSIGGQSLPAGGGVNRKRAWSAWYYIYKAEGNEALKTMSALFRDFNKSGYGGEKWAVASDLLYERFAFTLGPDNETNRQMFVDRVFTLEHNGGCFLNKLGWANKRKGQAGTIGIESMPSTVLDYQHSNPPNIKKLWEYASEDVQILVKSYLDLALDNGLDIMGVWGDVQAPTPTAKAKAKAKAPKSAPVKPAPVKPVKPVNPILVNSQPMNHISVDPSIVTTTINVNTSIDNTKSAIEALKEEIAKPIAAIPVHYQICPVSNELLPDNTGLLTITFTLQYIEGKSVHKYELSPTALYAKKFSWKHMVKKNKMWQGKPPIHMNIDVAHSYGPASFETSVIQDTIWGNQLLGKYLTVTASGK